METFILIALWLGLSFVIASFGGGRKVGYTTALIVSLLLSPLVGLIVVALSDKKGGKRWKLAEENAKRAAHKGDITQAIDQYKDAIYYLENDYPNLSGHDEARRQETLARLRSKVSELQETVQ